MVGHVRRRVCRIRSRGLSALPRLDTSQPRSDLRGRDRTESVGAGRRARHRHPGRRPVASVRLVGHLRRAVDGGSIAGIDGFDHRRDRSSVVVGGALSGYRRRHSERDPHTDEHTRPRCRHDRRRHPQLLGPRAQSQDRPDSRPDEHRAARRDQPRRLSRPMLGVLRPATRAHDRRGRCGGARRISEMVGQHGKTGKSPDERDRAARSRRLPR